MQLSDWFALTPALSPRRGSANFASVGIKSRAEPVHATDAAKAPDWSIAASALPLLGERAGVRADIPLSLNR